MFPAMSDAKINAALDTLDKIALGTIAANQLVNAAATQLKLSEPAKRLARAVVESADAHELREWVKHFIKTQVEKGGVPLNKVFHNVAAVHGGETAVTAKLEKQMVEAARGAE
jgi:hypothetical protein